MEQRSAALDAMSDAVLAIAAELSVEPILERLVHSARELVDARYAALGVPDGRGGFAQFITAGMSDELIASLGPLPRTHGLLGAMLEPDAAPPRGTAHPPPPPLLARGRRRRPAADDRHPPRPALSRLVADRAPLDVLVSRRPDRRARQGPRRLLPLRQ